MRTAPWLLPLPLLLVACGDGDVPNPGAAGPGLGPECADAICLPPPERGFQVRSVGATIEPGEDVEYCEVVELPGGPDDVYFVNRFESQMTGGSHHLIVEAIEPGSPTEANAQPGDRVECITSRAFGEDLGAVTGSQAPYKDETYPEGVGRRYVGGQRLVFDYHYFNTGSEPLAAAAAVNFHTVEAERVHTIARNFGFYNFGIDTPPGAEASFTSECAFDREVTVYKLTRHTHQWGTDFEVWRAGGAHDGEQVLVSDHYEKTDFVLPEPMQLGAGEGFRFACSYRNTESYPLVFGVEATDEMCILFGVWWPTDGGEATDQSCASF